MEVSCSFNELFSDKQTDFGSLSDELRGIELGNNCLQNLGREGRGGEGGEGGREGGGDEWGERGGWRREM